MVLDTPTATAAMSNQQEHRDASLKTVAQNADSNQHDEEELRHESPPQRRSSSYRILGTFTPHVDEDAAEAEQEEDPMAWADLEAFGGTKKTLEKKRPPRKLTADEVREQLRELHEIDSKMQEAVVQTKATSGMVDTIAWLKKHQEEAALQAERSDKRKRPLKRSTSFVRSVLDFFRGHSNSDLAHATDNQVQAQDKHVEEEETVATETSSLESPWGQETLHADWTEVGFALLNQGVLEDIARVRPVITSGELQGASPQAMIALSKWLWHFDEHVDHVATLKQYLLDERTIIAGVGYRVTTLYDTYKAALRASLAATHGDSADLSRLILEMFDHLELTLKDELVAVKDVVAQTLTEAQEYEALSTLFQSLEDDAECCVIVAKLLGFMKNHMPQEETDAFLALFDRDMKDKLAGEWMRHYATYLQLLDDFSVSFEGSRAYFT